MSVLAELVGRMKALLFGGRADREHQDEVRFHLAMQAQQLERAGLTKAESLRRARLAFGSVEGTREAARDARGVRWLDDLRLDIPYALRQLRRTPSFTAVAVLTLGLGIGANAALFSVVDGVLLRPIPFAEPDRLVVVWENDRRSGTTREPASWPDYVDFAREARTLDASTAMVGVETSYAPERGDPERVSSLAITNGFFTVTGVKPLAGRPFAADDDREGAPLVVLLGERFWRTRFDADPGVVGRTIRIDEQPREVVGIIPAGMDFGIDQIHARAAYHAPYSGVGDIDVWLPLQATEASFPRETHPFFILGRLAPGATLGSATGELTAIAARLEQTFPSNAERGVTVETLREVVFAPVRPVLYLLLSAVGLVLLVACVNVANLLLARSAVRLREVGVREALGAGFARLCRQFATESIMLSLLGGALGIALAFGGLRLLLSLAPAGIPRLDEVGIDGRVLAVTLVVSLAVGLGFGLVPALQARRVDLAETFKGDGRGASAGGGRKRLREALVVAELALSVMLVLCAGLLLRSVGAVTAVDPGFRVAGVLKAEYQLPERRYPRDFKTFPKWPEYHRFNGDVLARVRAIPGVEAAAIAGAHPLDVGFTNSFTIVGRESEARDWPEISVRLVTPGYFETVGVGLRRGRLLEDGDDADAPRVALVNAAAADRFFAGRDPVGAEIRYWGMPHRVVGVVDNERFKGLTEPAAPAVYGSMSQAPQASGVLLVRAKGDGEPMSLAVPVRAAIRAADPLLAVHGVEPLADTLRSSLGDRRFAMVVLGAFAALTLALALIGIHGVLRYATAQRTREIGIRLALGATRRDAAGLVLRGGMILAAIGTTVGLVAAAAASRMLTTLLYGVTRSDPATYVAVGSIVLAAAALAIALPAVAAARIQPVEALRHD